jgi:hypothetical protein
MFKYEVMVATAVAFGAVGSASSPSAWASLERQVARTCLASSGLTQAKIVSDKASFSDRVPIELRIVEGYNSGPVVDVRLCAYDRRTGRAAITDGVGRLGVHRS